jgi:hypothetical protein
MDNLKLHEDVAESIRKNLPEVAAAELKKFIDEAQKTAQRLAIKENELKVASAKVGELTNQLSEHRTLDEKLKEIETKNKDLEARELALRLSTADNKALVAEGRLASAMEVMGLVFRNQTISQSILGTVPVAVEGQKANQYNPCSSPGYVAPGEVRQTVETTTK